MNRKEIAELRKRMNPDNSAIGRIRGCYVNNKKEVVSAFERSLISLPQEEAEKYMSLFKKVLSGTPDKNLVDISFTNDQVLGSEEHRLLTSLYETSLKDDDAVQALCMKIIDQIAMDGNYLILLMQDAYDVPFRTRDDMALEDASGEVFSYIVCAVCPVKPSKPALRYVPSDNEILQAEVEPTRDKRKVVFPERLYNVGGLLQEIQDLINKNAIRPQPEGAFLGAFSRVYVCDPSDIPKGQRKGGSLEDFPQLFR